jgi:carbon monoxide dehydrogenase subunit G
MKLEHEFTVMAPLEEVWALLLDVERVAPCLPGGQVTGRVNDTTYNATVSVKLGPMNMTYRGEIAITEADEAARRAVMSGRASEARGQGTARATITTTLAPDGGGTHAQMVTDLELTGRVAQMGRGIVKDVSDRLIGEFASCLSQRLTAAPAAAAAGEPEAPPPAPPQAKPISGLRLILDVLRARLARLFGRR